MNRTVAIALAIGLLGALGCSKSDPPAGTSGSGSAASAATSTVAVTAADSAAPAKSEAGAGASTAAATAGGAKASYHGAYSLKAANMYVPDSKDWNNVKFKNDESKLTGDGDLTIDVDGSRVSGTSEGGALGAAIIEGTTDGTTLTANVRRKDPADQGLMGTIIAKIAGDKIEGSMRLSDGNAAAVREATFAIAKK